MTELSTELVPGRSCDGCTMCCKLLDIDVLQKPRGVWCAHCDQKRGCKIYAERPEPCRSFHCGWLRIAYLDEHWKPSRSKILVNFEEKAKRIAIHVDPSRPDAWRQEPFQRTIRDWARNAARDRGTVMVWAGEELTVVLPARDLHLGKVRPDQFVIPIERRGPSGVEIGYEVVEADDPRLQL